MTRHLARLWPAYLAFAILLLLVDPVARGLVACASDKAPGGCPVIGGGR